MLLNAISTKFEIVLQYYDSLNNKYITNDDLVNYLNSCGNIEFYSFILHDRDYNENGEIKTQHYHIIIRLISKLSAKTIINSIATNLLINKNIISIQCIKNFQSCIRYLTHDNTNKYKYPVEDVITNNIFEYDNLYNYGDCEDIDFNTLLEVIERHNTLKDIYGLIGLKNSTKYRHIINDLFKEKKNNENKN